MFDCVLGEEKCFGEMQTNNLSSVKNNVSVELGVVAFISR